MCVMLSILTVGCSGSDDDTGLPIIDIGTEAEGTCLVFTDEVDANVTSLPSVPCIDSHTHEIYAILDSAADTYPGFDALETEAQAACLGAFEPYVGISAFDSSLFYSWLVPTLSSWESESDREIICVLANLNGAPLIGSMRDSAR